MELLMIMVFSLALNTDCLLAGIAYGIQGIKLPLRSLLVVSLTSGLVLALSMLLGLRVGELMPAAMINSGASLALAFIGIYRIIAVKLFFQR